MSRELQLYAAGKGVKQWKIAEEMGLPEATLSRKLRKPLSEEEEAAFLAAVEKLSKEKEHTA